MLKFSMERGFMELNIRLLFLQGLWYEEPAGDFTYFSQFYGPWLSRLIVRYPFVRLALQTQRYLQPRLLLGHLMNHILFIHPVDVIVNFDDKLGLLENGFIIGLAFLTITATLALFLNKKRTKNYVQSITDILDLNRTIDEKEDEKIRKIMNLGHFFTFYIHVLLMLVFVSAEIAFIIFQSIPKRVFFTKSWYPYEFTASPYFELTLAFETIYTTIFALVGTSFACFTIILLSFYGFQLQVLGQQLRNLRPWAVLQIQTRSCPRNDVSKLSSKFMIVECLAFGERTLVDGGTSWREGRDVEEGEDDEAWGRHLSRVTRNSESRANILENEVVVDLGGNSKALDEELVELRLNSKELDDEMMLGLKRCIRTHVILLRLVKDFALMFNELAVVLVILNVAGTGAVFLLVLNVEVVTVKEVTLVIIFVVIVFQSFMFNFLTDWVSEQSGKVGEAAYECDWLRASNSFKRCLQIVASRANSPFVFKPDGMDPLSVEQFRVLSVQAYKMLATLTSMVK